EAFSLVGRLAGHSQQHLLSALFLDYGHTESGWGDTLQAVRGHRFSPILEHPGEADLTAHVDFGRLSLHAQICGASLYGPRSQGDFLDNMGIRRRAAKLKEGKSS